MRAMKKAKRSKVRLTSDVVPTRYEIRLKPDLEAFVFEGEETIHLSLKRAVKTLTLHSVELEIESACVVEDRTSVFAEKISYDEKAETATLTFKKTLPPGEAKLRLVFRGMLNDKMHGFYRSKYAGHGGKEKHMATTQFESTDARRAFPCFDEPSMKAVFDISLVVPQESEAISNTLPIDIAEHESGYKTVTFAPTPLMSTYLLAFVVGDFEKIEKKSKDGVLVRVFTTPGKKHQAKFALDAAAKIITFFNDYFDIPYPMPAVDLIAIPDFAAGAMENWGAITYRESALLVDPEHSSTMNKQWVALVIAHELAHQWFGNLVTMEWWTHLWLNEGFASYIEYLAVDHIFPKWDIWTQFLQNDFGVALHYDGLKHTHPIEVDVHHPAEITSAFDAVSYSKGASIIRMLADYLGETKFRNGLRHYLKKHSYKNAETGDLWNALARVSGKPVADIMTNWTGKPGYPVVTMLDKQSGFELRQSRFFSSPISERETRDSTTWRVPVSFQHGEKKGQVLLSSRQVAVPNGDPHFHLNLGQTALFRTDYPPRVQETLGKMVRAKKLKTRDRLGVLRDVWAMAENGKKSAVDALTFSEHYKKDNQYVVWGELAGGLGKIHSLFVYEPFINKYEERALAMFSDIAEHSTFTSKPKDHSDALLKVLILESLAKYGDTKTVAQAKKMFAKPQKISADLRGVVYNTVARYGGAREYAKLMKMYKESTLHEEKNRIGRSLGMFRQKNLLQKTLEFAISDDVRSQDSVRMIGPVAVNPAGRDIAWSFIKKNWKFFNMRFAGARDLNYLLEPLGVSASVERAKDIEAFLRKHPAPGTERTALQVLERISSNAAWLARDRKKLSAVR